MADTPTLHASIDSYFLMFDFNIIEENERKDCMIFAADAFHKSVATLAAAKYPVVVDTVFQRQEAFEKTMGYLKDLSVILVGVHCPLNILEKRELERGDRQIGLAKRQIDIVHQDKVYDLEVDTSKLSSEDCANLILQRMKTKC